MNRVLPPQGIRRVVLFTLLLVPGACGGSDSPDQRDMRVDDDAAMDTTPAGTPAPPSLETIAADQQRSATVALTDTTLVIDRDALPPGEITLEVANTGSSPHAVAITSGDEEHGRTQPIPPGGIGSLSVSLPAGTYRLLCPDSTGGSAHADRGQSAPLVIR